MAAPTSVCDVRAMIFPGYFYVSWIPPKADNGSDNIYYKIICSQTKEQIEQYVEGETTTVKSTCSQAAVGGIYNGLSLQVLLYFNNGGTISSTSPYHIKILPHNNAGYYLCDKDSNIIEIDPKNQNLATSTRLISYCFAS